MDYENATDEQINKAVTMAVGKFKDSDYSSVSGNYHKGNVFDCNYSVGVVHDYCNNPSYAWPIILEDKINLLWNTESTEWEAQAVVTIDMYQPPTCEYYYYDKNPLRAAMIVYLMMNEDKK